jgi:hypothetical protein
MYILWNKGEQSLINTWLGGFSATPTDAPWVPDANVYVGLGAKLGGVGTNKAANNGLTSDTLFEIGQGTANGYTRRPIARDAGSTGWPQASQSSGSYQSTAPQVTFGAFTGSGPTTNGATIWFVALNGSIGADNCIFGADLAATRTFAAGDTERITITYRQT